MSSEEWKLVCKWCGKLIKPDSFKAGKWYHEKYGFWCLDSTGTRRAPKPDYDASQKINVNKRGDIYSRLSDKACPKCKAPSLEQHFYVFYNGPQSTGFFCTGCNSSFNEQMQEVTITLQAGAEKRGDGWDN